MNKKIQILENITLVKFVHGGQCLADTADGKKLFVWGGLPGEVVNVKVTKKKSSFLEGVVVDVITASKDRVEAEEPESYLSTSPWQIVDFNAEQQAKAHILAEAFDREKVVVQWQDFQTDGVTSAYRNKMEFGFWGDETGLHLAHYVRGTHGKQMVAGSVLAKEEINVAARAICEELDRLKIRAGDLKTIMLRCNKTGDVVAALFMKESLDLGEFNVPTCVKGMKIYFSNPKSPASVPTKKLYSFGDIKLSDVIMGKNITYDVMSFFQVNLPVFEQALSAINDSVGTQSAIDLYSGVGTIGLSVKNTDILVELDESNIRMAQQNAKGTLIKVVQASSEQALEYIDQDHVVILDPPRAGLHYSVVDRLLEVKPSKIVYLSCNPSTQARDVKHLSESYMVTFAKGYNFFPRTPHIESLIVLEAI